MQLPVQGINTLSCHLMGKKRRERRQMGRRRR
jgi:hypothetical protein